MTDDIPGTDSASGPGRSVFFTSPTCSDGRAWDATWASYSFKSCSDAHRSSEALKMRITPSLHPLTISPLGMTDTAHTEIAGCTITCVHSSPGMVKTMILVAESGERTLPDANAAIFAC